MPVQVPLILAILMQLLPAVMACGRAGDLCPVGTTASADVSCCGGPCCDSESLPCDQENSESKSCCLMCCSFMNVPLVAPRVEPSPVLPVGQVAVEPVSLDLWQAEFKRHGGVMWANGPPRHPPGWNQQAWLCCWTT